MTFPGLIVHLIREHGFFEGDTSYRLDPATACSVLELKSEEDYTPKRFPITRIVNGPIFSGRESNQQEKIDDVKRTWIKVLDTQQLGEWTFAYLAEVPLGQEQSSILRDGRFYNAKLYIHNTRGEQLPDKAIVFGNELTTLHRADRVRDFLIYIIKPLPKYVLNPQDRMQ